MIFFEAVPFLWNSPWTWRVGIRYLKSKKSSRFLSFITLLSLMGVGIGVTAMIVVLSIMDGFEDQLKKRLMATDLHILVTPTSKIAGFDQGRVPQEAFKLPLDDSRIEVVFPMVTTEVVLRTGKRVKGVVVKGADEARLLRLKEQMIEVADPALLAAAAGKGEGRQAGVWIGKELAYEMGLIPGDEVQLISPLEVEGPLSSIPKMRQFRVEGIYHSGLPEQELFSVYARNTDVWSFLRKKDVLTQWEILLHQFDDAPEVAQKLREGSPEFKVQDWMELNSNLFFSLKLERISMFIILACIVVVASFNIVTTLTLMILEKKKEIAILKAMGTRNGEVGAIFLAEGLLIGVVGVVGGMVASYGICLLLRRYEFITLPEIYYDRTLPVTFNVNYYLGVAAAAFVIVLLACLYPARKAARLEPLQGIRA